MKKLFHLQIEAKKHRFKRQAADALKEIGQVLLLIGGISAVTLLLFFIYDWTIRSPYLSIKETIVRGCKELTEKDILDLAALRPGANILTLNPDAMARRIRMNPWVREVHIGREFPDRLVIVVRERTAIALLQKDKRLYLLDSNGDPFKTMGSDDEPNLPILTGFVREGITDQKLVMKSVALLTHLASAKDIPVIGAVSEIHGNETFGLSLITDTGLCLQLGLDGYESKLSKLIPVMADLERKNLKTGFLLIDLSDPTKINVQQRTILEPAKPAGAGKRFRM